MPMPTRTRAQGPSAAKVAVARLGPVYRWARRLRAYSRYAARRPHDPDFAAFGQIAGEGLFLDVGASIGQSALSFRVFNKTSPILSLEPLPTHRKDLEFVRRMIRGHSFMMAGAAERSCRATLYVPMLGGYELPAESSLRREDAEAVLARLRGEGVDPARLRLNEVEVELRRLDELELEPSFVKIDVEGAELEVLQGLRETIDRSQPALMLERSERIDQVLELLVDGAGYSAFVYDAGRGELRPYELEETVNVFFLREQNGARG